MQSTSETVRISTAEEHVGMTAMIAAMTLALVMVAIVVKSVDCGADFDRGGGICGKVPVVSVGQRYLYCPECIWSISLGTGLGPSHKGFGV